MPRYGSGCGLIMGGAGGYRMICGGLWYGRVAKCEDCKQRETSERIAQKQEQLLDLQIAALKK